MKAKYGVQPLGRGSLAAFGFLLAHSVGVEAQETRLDQVSVTADRLAAAREEFVGDSKVEVAPSSRASLTKKQLEKLAGISSVYDSLKYLPGVNSQGGNSYGSGGASFTVRGFNGGQIGIVRDGLPLNDPLFQTAVGSVIGDPEDYESIQLIYGASAASLPSVTASGGSILLKTVAPTVEPGVLLKQSFGNYDVSKSYARANFGEHNGFSGWLSASTSGYDNWRGDAPHARTDRYGANLQYRWDENQVNLIISTQEMFNYSSPARSKLQYKTLPYDHGYPALVYPTQGGTNGVNDRVTPQASQLVNSTSFHVQNYMLNGRFKLADNLRLSIDPYFQRIRGGTVSSGPVTLNEVALNTDLNGDGDKLDTGVPFALQMLPAQYRPGGTAKLDWQVSDTHKLQFGGWYERIHSRQTFAYVPIGANGRPVTTNGESKIAVDGRGNKIYRSDQRTDMPTFKFWAEDVWNFNPELTITSTLAYHQTEVEAHNVGLVLNRLGGLDYGNPGYERDKTYRRYLPALALDYQYDEHNQFYYSISSNIRIPAAAALYSVVERSQKPETTINQELGWRYKNAGLSSSVALFNADFKNRQVSYLTPENITAYYNAGKVKTQGVEFALNGLLPRDFNYSLSYAYVLAEQQENFDVEELNGFSSLPTKGKQLFNTPKHLASVGFGYDDGNLYGDIRALYKSSIYGDLTNKESIAGVTTVNLALGYRLHELGNFAKEATLSLNVNNLFNKEYLQGVSAGQFSSDRADGRLAGTPTYVVAEPRTLIASLQLEF